MPIWDKELDGEIKPTRRGFLGSVIGLFAAANIPWIAAEPKAKAIELPNGCLLDWKNYIRLTNGAIIQGSGIKGIDDKGNLILCDITTTRQLNVAGSILWYKNKLVSNADFVAHQSLWNGDTLKITHNVNITLPNGTIITPEHPDWYYFINFKNENNIHKY